MSDIGILIRPWVKKHVDMAVEKAVLQAYNQAKAYTDLQLKTVTPTMLYLRGDSTMTTDKPTLVVNIDKTLTTTEVELFQFAYSIPAAGILLANNIYTINLWTFSGSSSKDVYLRFKYSIGDMKIFDFTEKRPRTTDPFKIIQSIVNEQNIDISYTGGQPVILKVYGKVSSGAQTLRFTFNDDDHLNSLTRNLVT